jgi:hypothetical protein
MPDKGGRSSGTSSSRDEDRNSNGEAETQTETTVAEAVRNQHTHSSGRSLFSFLSRIDLTPWFSKHSRPS